MLLLAFVWDRKWLCHRAEFTDLFQIIPLFSAWGSYAYFINRKLIGMWGISFSLWLCGRETLWIITKIACCVCMGSQLWDIRWSVIWEKYGWISLLGPCVGTGWMKISEVEMRHFLNHIISRSYGFPTLALSAPTAIKITS